MLAEEDLGMGEALGRKLGGVEQDGRGKGDFGAADQSRIAGIDEDRGLIGAGRGYPNKEGSEERRNFWEKRIAIALRKFCEFAARPE